MSLQVTSTLPSFLAGIKPSRSSSPSSSFFHTGCTYKFSLLLINFSPSRNWAYLWSNHPQMYNSLSTLSSHNHHFVTPHASLCDITQQGLFVCSTTPNEGERSRQEEWWNGVVAVQNNSPRRRSPKQKLPFCKDSGHSFPLKRFQMEFGVFVNLWQKPR